MSLSEQTARVAGGGKNTLKTMLQKLGVSVGTQTIDQYPTLANQISNKLLPNNLISSSTATSLGLSGTATPNEAFAKIKALIDAANSNANTKCRIASGSYVGNGLSGESNPMVLQFPFKPKYVTIPTTVNSDGRLEISEVYSSAGNPILAIDSVPTGSEYSDRRGSYSGPLGYDTCYRYDNNTNTLYFFSDSDAHHQQNQAGQTYYWIAVG